MTAAADVLDRAAALIERDGWVQGDYGWSGVGWCASGAIREAARPVTLKVHVSAGSALRAAIGPGIERWNDDPDRTQADVLAVLREIAARLRQGVGSV